MMTLLSTFLSFGAGGLPKLLNFFQNRADNKHELAMAKIAVVPGDGIGHEVVEQGRSHGAFDSFRIIEDDSRPQSNAI